jgi:hypothetical protein
MANSAGFSPRGRVIFLVAVVVCAASLVAVYIASSVPAPTGPCTDCTPANELGSIIGLKGPTGGVSAPYQYTFTIAWSNRTIYLSDLQPDVATPYGESLSPGADWSLLAYGPGAGPPVGSFDFANETPGWTSGADEPVTTGMTFVLNTGSMSLTGNWFLLWGTSANPMGSVHVAIP